VTSLIMAKRCVLICCSLFFAGI